MFAILVAQSSTGQAEKEAYEHIGHSARRWPEQDGQICTATGVADAVYGASERPAQPAASATSAHRAPTKAVHSAHAHRHRHPAERPNGFFLFCGQTGGASRAVGRREQKHGRNHEQQQDLRVDDHCGDLRPDDLLQSPRSRRELKQQPVRHGFVQL